MRTGWDGLVHVDGYTKLIQAQHNQPGRFINDLDLLVELRWRVFADSNRQPGHNQHRHYQDCRGYQTLRRSSAILLVQGQGIWFVKQCSGATKGSFVVLCQDFHSEEQIQQLYQHKRSESGDARGQIKATEATTALHAWRTLSACIKPSLASWLPVMERRRSLAVKLPGAQRSDTSRHGEKDISATVGQRPRFACRAPRRDPQISTDSGPVNSIFGFSLMPGPCKFNATAGRNLSFSCGYGTECFESHEHESFTPVSGLRDPACTYAPVLSTSAIVPAKATLKTDAATNRQCYVSYGVEPLGRLSALYRVCT